MEKILPTVVLHDDKFYLDVKYERLIDSLNPDNIIPLRDTCFTDRDRGIYEFSYDPVTRNIPDFDYTHSKYTEVGALVKIDPEGMAEKFGKSISEINNLSDLQLNVDQSALTERLGGLLPTIKILGEIFYVDLRMGCLRADYTHPERQMYFNDIDHFYDEQSNTYALHMDSKKKIPVDVDWSTATKIPPGLVVVRIPPEENLDPVGYARLHGLDMEAHLRFHKIDMRMESKIIPWNQTPAIDLTRQNLERSKKEGRGRTRGKGL